MSLTTNKLVVRTSRLAVPTATVLALVLAGTMALRHTDVHAASNIATPLDENSVSSLVSLDKPVESVASRVTPAVVNVAVTSRGSHEQATSENDGPEQDQGQMQG